MTTRQVYPRPARAGRFWVAVVGGTALFVGILSQVPADRTDVLFGVFIVAVLFSGLGAWVASVKHRSNGEGAVLGGLLGPLGVIIEALLPTQTGATPAIPATASPELTRKCPDCAETIKAEAHVCRFCGRRFSDEQASNAVAVDARQL